MVKALRIARKARGALKSFDLLTILRSEISHEVSNDRFKDWSDSGLSEHFAIEHDSIDSKDVFLRRKSDSGEEVVVSAVLSPEVVSGGEDVLPNEAAMKVCVKKPGVSSILEINCVVAETVNGSEMNLSHVLLHPTVEAAVGPVYKYPNYGIGGDLQNALMEFLRARGIDGGFSSWLLLYLHKKEQGQYVDWLRKIEAFVAPESESQGESNEPH